jgi:hypothetical protein
MQAKNEFLWSQCKVEEVTGMSRQQRESAACARRIAQMEKKREKLAKREVNRISEKDK